MYRGAGVRCGGRGVTYTHDYAAVEELLSAAGSEPAHGAGLAEGALARPGLRLTPSPFRWILSIFMLHSRCPGLASWISICKSAPDTRNEYGHAGTSGPPSGRTPYRGGSAPRTACQRIFEARYELTLRTCWMHGVVIVDCSQVVENVEPGDMTSRCGRLAMWSCDLTHVTLLLCGAHPSEVLDDVCGIFMVPREHRLSTPHQGNHPHGRIRLTLLHCVLI